jgi:hypothetical protein
VASSKQRAGRRELCRSASALVRGQSRAPGPIGRVGGFDGRTTPAGGRISIGLFLGAVNFGLMFAPEESSTHRHLKPAEPLGADAGTPFSARAKVRETKRIASGMMFLKPLEMNCTKRAGSLAHRGDAE